MRDLAAIAGRALRQMPREPFAFLPAVFIPAFFYAVNLGALGHVAGEGGLDYKAFLLPMAIAFAVTGISRAPTLVTDIQSGYFDRLCMTPVRRLALLLGLMAADVVVIVALSVPVLVMGFAVGVRFATGVAGCRLRRPCRRCGGWSSPASPTPWPSRPAAPPPSTPPSSSSSPSPS